MQAIYNSTKKVPFRYNDELRVLDATVSSNYYEAGWYYQEQLKEYTGKFNGVLEFYAGWQTGVYKLVLFMEGTKVPMAISSNFELRDD